MPRTWVKFRVKVKISKNRTKSIVSNVRRILENRFDSVCDQLVGELKTSLSKVGPSSPGQPPGITRTHHRKRDRKPGRLRDSIRWVRDNTTATIRRRIGSSQPHALWMELGVAGGVIIRPKSAKALTIPITEAEATRLIARLGRKLRTRNNKGARSRQRRSINRGGKIIGVVKRRDGQWFVLLRWVKQGRIAPRPWLKPVMNKNLRRVGLTLGQKIY